MDIAQAGGPEGDGQEGEDGPGPPEDGGAPRRDPRRELQRVGHHPLHPPQGGGSRAWARWAQWGCAMVSCGGDYFHHRLNGPIMDIWEQTFAAGGGPPLGTRTRLLVIVWNDNHSAKKYI